MILQVQGFFNDMNAWLCFLYCVSACVDNFLALSWFLKNLKIKIKSEISACKTVIC